MNRKLLAAGLSGLALTGCLSAVSYVPVQRYGIVPEIQTEQRETDAGALAVRALESAQPYSAGMLYRPDEYAIAYRSNEEWAETPRNSVTRALVDSLAATNYFQDIGSTSDVPLPMYILTGELRRFDEVRASDPPQALCEVRIELRENRRPARSLLSKTYRESVPMSTETAGALAEAMTRAVSAIVAQATEDIVAAVERSQEDGSE